MRIRIIKSPSESVLEIIAKRTARTLDREEMDISSIGLVEGRMSDMIYAADIAEKTVGVEVYDLQGNCPQSFIVLAIIGDTSSVESAIDEIKTSLKGEKIHVSSKINR